jgi:hypothetical protein
MNHVLRISNKGGTVCDISRPHRKPIKRLTLRDQKYADEVVNSILPRKRRAGKTKFRLALRMKQQMDDHGSWQEIDIEFRTI